MTATLMTRFNVPDQERSVDRTETNVTTEALLLLYPEIAERARIVHPDRAAHLCGRPVRCEQLEPFVLVLPSPFREAADSRLDVIVFPRARQWCDFSGLKPSDVPDDFIGFVMAHSNCSQADALAILNGAATKMAAAGPEERRVLEEMAALMEEEAAIEFLGGSIRERILASLN